MTKEAFAAFREITTRFPESKYAPDSLERMRYLTNALAGYEVHVARYYYNRGAYLAAANRAQATLTNYPKTPANEDALIVLVNSYDKLKMPQLRASNQIVVAILGQGRVAAADRGSDAMVEILVDRQGRAGRRFQARRRFHARRRSQARRRSHARRRFQVNVP